MESEERESLLSSHWRKVESPLQSCLCWYFVKWMPSIQGISPSVTVSRMEVQYNFQSKILWALQDLSSLGSLIEGTRCPSFLLLSSLPGKLSLLSPCTCVSRGAGAAWSFWLVKLKIKTSNYCSHAQSNELNSECRMTLLEVDCAKSSQN